MESASQVADAPGAVPGEREGSCGGAFPPDPQPLPTESILAEVGLFCGIADVG